jgi:HEAT repeat protein
MRRLYYLLGLQEDTFKKVRSIQWHIKVKGFKELSALDITEKNDVLYKCINSRNHILRMEAQIALVNLSDKEPFEFLDKLVSPFSLWEQITLHQVMVQNDIKAPNFGRWLNHENHTVIMFALRMIREYNQTWNSVGLVTLMNHNNEEVRKLAIEVMGDLKMSDALISIKKIYKDETYDNQLELLRSMGKCPTPEMSGFLQKVIDKEDSAAEADEKLRRFVTGFAENQIDWDQVKR